MPMDPNYPEQRLAYMARDAEAPVLLTHQGLRCRLPHNNLSTQVCDFPCLAKPAAKSSVQSCSTLSVHTISHAVLHCYTATLLKHNVTRLHIVSAAGFCCNTYHALP